MFAIGIFLDLRKAFDVCSHPILLAKLQKMGITGTALKWFESYLTGRTQCVELNDVLSDPKAINISVIQGSILGPILFLCYINDIWRATVLFLLLFADDTAGLAKGKNLNELIVYVNEELQKLANWLRANKMAVNVQKTKYVIFRTREQEIAHDIQPVVFNNNEIGKIQNPEKITPLQRIYGGSDSTSYKLLGVLFDEYLSFDDHISSIKSKISKGLYCMNCLKNFLPVSALKTLYFSLIHPHISYCINIYEVNSESNVT
jgi:hypothetical protein